MITDDSDWTLSSDALALFSSLEKGTEGETSGDLSALEQSINDADLLDASYLEAFTDLRNYLLDETQSEVTSAMDNSQGADALWTLPAGSLPVPTATTTETLPPVFLDPEGVKPVKRTAAAAFGFADVAPSNPDHNDYVLKKKVKTESVGADSSTASTTTTTLSKAEKYAQRRMKNNVASKRSRETRKQKFSEMELKAQELERHNEELKGKVEQLEKLAKEMKEALVQKLAHGK